MGIFRGTDIENQKELVDHCRRVLIVGDPGRISEILPHIRVLRSPEFFSPLAELLHRGRSEQQAAAALGLGSLGDPSAVPDLLAVYRTAAAAGPMEDSVLSAIISALGDIPVAEAARSLIEIYQSLRVHRRPSYASALGAIVISSLGQLAQQSVAEAEEKLIQLLDDGQEEVRALAVTELCLAYWHRPQSISGDLLKRVFELAQDTSEDVRSAAIGSLSNLAQLGAEEAEALLDRLG